MAFKPTHITFPSNNLAVLIANNDALQMDFDPELNLIAQAITQAQEQLWAVMDMQY